MSDMRTYRGYPVIGSEAIELAQNGRVNRIDQMLRDGANYQEQPWGTPIKTNIAARIARARKSNMGSPFAFDVREQNRSYGSSAANAPPQAIPVEPTGLPSTQNDLWRRIFGKG